MNNKPVAWMDENENVIFEKNWAYPIPLYTHPVKELTHEKYFCSRCGKRLGDGIHTCTPPVDILRKTQEQ